MWLLQIRRRRLARLAALSGPATPASPPVTPGASVPDPLTPQQQLTAHFSPIPAPRGSTDPSIPSESDAPDANKEPNYTDSVSKDVSDQNKIPADGIIVTEKTDSNLLDEMPDTKMTDLSQTRQYNSFDSMGDDTLLTCGSVRVASLPQSTVVGSAATREDSTSRSVSPPQFAEPPPVRPRTSNESPSCSRRSLSMEVDDVSDRSSQSKQQSEPMEVCLLLPNSLCQNINIIT